MLRLETRINITVRGGSNPPLPGIHPRQYTEDYKARTAERSAGFLLSFLALFFPLLIERGSKENPAQIRQAKEN